ncbi:MAG: DUF116 domain-containing protein [Desulfovibrionaceae bacterium]|nr:DUF116 domain-containing protein [Desulfovibrionaceae bacterium]
MSQDRDFMRIGSKRLFVGLICGAAAVLCGALIFGWGVPYVGLGNIHPALPYITGGLLILIVAIVAWSAIGLVLQILSGRNIFGGRARGLAIKLFLPISEGLGKLLGLKAQDIRRSFIQVNNDMILKQRRHYTPEKLLVLLPHCIQNSLCSIRLSLSLSNCERCGRCDLGSLLQLVEQYGAQIAIATGGTIARRIVVDKHPGLILAVACERDLSSGIQDTYPLPVYGILNERPHGPCRDTRVPLDRVEFALRRFLSPSPIGKDA